MQPRPSPPILFAELSWATAIPHGYGVSVSVCAFLCLLLGVLLILFAIQQMTKVRRIGRQLAVP